MSSRDNSFRYLEQQVLNTDVKLQQISLKYLSLEMNIQQLKTKPNTNKENINQLTESINNILQRVLKWSEQNIPIEFIRYWIKQKIQEISTLKGIEDRTVFKIVNDLKREVNQKQKIINDLEQNIKQATKTNQTLQNENYCLRRDNQSLFNENKQQVNKRFALEKYFNQTSSRLTNQKNALVSQLNNTQQSLNKKIVQINQNYMKLVMEHNTIMTKKELQEKKYKQIQRQLIKRTEQIKNNFNHLNYLSNKNRALENEKITILEQKRIQVLRLKEDGQKNRSQIKDLELNIQSLRTQRRNLQQSIKKSSSMYIDLSRVDNRQNVNMIQTTSSRRRDNRDEPHSNRSILRGKSGKRNDMEVNKQVQRDEANREEREKSVYHFKTIKRDPVSYLIKRAI